MYMCVYDKALSVILPAWNLGFLESSDSCFVANNSNPITQVSYMILQRVSPVTHSVGNCVKRVVVIVSSVLFFQTPVTPVNALGKIIHLTFAHHRFYSTRVVSFKLLRLVFS